MTGKGLWICVLGAICGLAFAQKPQDPAAWGGNHVGQPIPDYVHGDECLFCHRYDVGTTWQKNRHGVTVRKREDAPEIDQWLSRQPRLASIASQVEYFLGSRDRVRLLKKHGYGKFALLTTGDKPAWDERRFGDRCAGCHSTAVEAKSKSFSAFGLDCYTCHGDVDLAHTSDTSKVLLSKKHRSDSLVIASICAQCHLRGGKSRSSGLPYANNFVAGDNLFQDFDVDFSKADDESLNPGDRHVLRNVRDVVVSGQTTPTCLSCHQVHAGTSTKHRRVLRADICWDCHTTGGPFKPAKVYAVKSAVCEY